MADAHHHSKFNEDIATETLKIIENKGYYINIGNDKPLFIYLNIDSYSKIYPGNTTFEINNNNNRNDNNNRQRSISNSSSAAATVGMFKTNIIVDQCSVIEGCERFVGILWDDDPSEMSKVAVLNFASATRPGGGFLHGSKAQEESLCRSSSLYTQLSSQKCKNEYYNVNNNDINHGIYNDNVIFTSNVAFFRDDKMMLLNEPYYINVISAPAPNFNVATKKLSSYDNNPDEIVQYIDAIYKERLCHVLNVALENNIDYLILGAWGTGIYGNPLSTVIANFKECLLKMDRYKNKFKIIMFAILDKKTCTEFANAFDIKFIERDIHWEQSQELINGYNQFENGTIHNKNRNTNNNNNNNNNNNK